VKRAQWTKLRHLPKIFRECLCLFEMYRRFGFPPESIFISPAKLDGDPRPRLGMHIKEGFTVATRGEYFGRELELDWTRVCEVAALATNQELEEMWRSMLSPLELVRIATEIENKGIPVPVIHEKLAN
jgi:hypothetical protein